MTKWLSSAALIVLLDRVTKIWIGKSIALGQEVTVLPVLSWVHFDNCGAAFSMLDDCGGVQRWFFVALAIVFSTYVLFELRRLGPSPRGLERLSAWAFVLILGGAVGNLYDRLTKGYVVDFVLVHYREHYFAAFNVADSGISVGAALWLLALALETHRARTRGAR